MKKTYEKADFLLMPALDADILTVSLNASNGDIVEDGGDYATLFPSTI